MKHKKYSALSLRRLKSNIFINYLLIPQPQ